MIVSGNPFGTARVVKYNDHINNMTYTSSFEQNPATRAAYMGGSDWTLTSQFNTGFSGFGFGYIPPSTLPVHIISFTAKENNKTVDLTWKTENEENLAYYKVMRSHDAGNYEAIGTVTARGSTGNIEEYRLNDPQPFTGKNFYQLVSYDRDQTFKKSQVVEVNIRSGIIYTVAPNPFTDKIIIGQSNTLQQTIQIKLTDLHGRIVLEKQINSAGGPSTINIPDVAAGIYLLKLTTEEGTQVFKLVKE